MTNLLKSLLTKLDTIKNRLNSIENSVTNEDLIKIERKYNSIKNNN